jgi:hypothetical protein
LGRWRVASVRLTTVSEEMSIIGILAWVCEHTSLLASIPMEFEL